MTKERNAKFIFGIPLRAIKIVGLILLVAAQAFPLRAFESHIVSVTAVIEPLPTTLVRSESLSLFATVGEQVPVLEPTLNADEVMTGDTTQADSGSSSASQEETVSGASEQQNDNNQNEQDNSANSPEPSIVPSNEPANGSADTSGSSEPLIQTQTEKIEVSSAETVLTIENVTPFQDNSGAAATQGVIIDSGSANDNSSVDAPASADVVGGGTEGAAGE